MQTTTKLLLSLLLLFASILGVKAQPVAENLAVELRKVPHDSVEEVMKKWIGKDTSQLVQLSGQLEKLPPSREKVEMAHYLATHPYLLKHHEEMAYSLLFKAVTLADSIGYEEGSYLGLSSLIRFHYDREQWLEALRYLQNRQRFSEQTGFNPEYLLIAEVAQKTGDFGAVFNALTATINQAKQSNSQEELVKSYLYAGDFLTGMEIYEMAIPYYDSTLQLLSLVPKKNDAEGMLQGTLHRLMVAYFESGSYAEALNYVNRMLKSELMQNPIRESSLLYWKGRIHFRNNKLEEAASSLQKSIQLVKEQGQTQFLPAKLEGLATVKLHLGDTLQARTYLEEARNLSISHQSFADLVKTDLVLGHLMLDQHKAERAVMFAREAYELSAKEHFPEQEKEGAELLQLAFQKTGNFGQSYQFLNRYLHLNDSLERARDARSNTVMRLQFQLEKEKELQELKTANQRITQQASEREQKIIFLSLTFLVLAFAIIALAVYRNYRLKAKANRLLKKQHQQISDKNEELQTQKEELAWQRDSIKQQNDLLTIKQKEIEEINHHLQLTTEELGAANEQIGHYNQDLEKLIKIRTRELENTQTELDSFLYHASHNLLRPVNSLDGLLQLLKSSPELAASEEVPNSMQKVLKSMDRMLKKLIMVSVIRYYQDTYRHFQEVKLKALIEQSLQEVLAGKGFKKEVFEVCVEDNLMLQTVPEVLNYLMINLAENALHFCQSNRPKCVISAEIENDQLLLQVEDKGMGIPAEIHHKVFEMFYRGNEHSPGDGLGLYVVKKAVEALQGEIYFESALGCGTLFQITIPLYTEAATPPNVPHL